MRKANELISKILAKLKSLKSNFGTKYKHKYKYKICIFLYDIHQKRKFENVSSRHTTDFGSTATSVSVTENTSVDEFLTNAEAAQKSFEAERGTAR